MAPRGEHGPGLECWSLSHDDLDANLRVSGLTPQSSTYTDGAERYLVTARR